MNTLDDCQDITAWEFSTKEHPPQFKLSHVMEISAIFSDEVFAAMKDGNVCIYAYPDAEPDTIHQLQVYMEEMEHTENIRSTSKKLEELPTLS